MNCLIIKLAVLVATVQSIYAWVDVERRLGWYGWKGGLGLKEGGGCLSHVGDGEEECELVSPLKDAKGEKL